MNDFAVWMIQVLVIYLGIFMIPLIVLIINEIKKGEDMRELKIYLAGKMSGLKYENMYEWRAYLKNKLVSMAEHHGQKAYVVNPVDFYNFENARHQTEIEIKMFDLNHVLSSDIVIVNLDGLATSDGTKYELHDAKKANIPVIAFGDYKLYEDLHPWTKDNITRVENNIDDIVEYIKDFYMC